LIVTSRFPLPPWRGNQVRTVEWLRALEGCDRTVVCPEPAQADARVELERLAEATWRYRLGFPSRVAGGAGGVFRGLPAQEGLYAAASARRAVRAALQTAMPDVVVVQMVRCGWAMDVAKSEAPGAAIVFDAIDAMGLHFDRAARRAPRFIKTLFSMEATRCRLRESRLADGAHIVTAVSGRDLAALTCSAGRGRVVPVSGRDMGMADCDRDRPTVLLSGNLGYRPTVEAALWFGDHVWPRVQHHVPAARWLLVGARPGRRVRALAHRPGVELAADVEDLSPYLARATAAIAPMASGSGVPMKLLEAWSAAVPVVADRWAADGLEPGGAEAVVIAGHPDEWVTALHRLLTDPEHAKDLGHRGRKVWETHYRFDRVAKEVNQALAEAIRFANC
jgi:glycosyltransferase involved in cell wall biosynthesis